MFITAFQFAQNISMIRYKRHKIQNFAEVEAA